ncbi:MAG: glycosyltransferase family 2 protein [candidate division Zixibacteria bacterium]|nr:glycosyltransferase family 2 protein [candidate division Zixibacteria bacterium]
MSLSVVIITKNEELNIERCLNSVKWADEIVIVDSDSTDRTVEFARRFGARVYTTEWRGYGPAKREAVNYAKGDWILSVDADEEVTHDLGEEIRNTLENLNDTDGYYVKRRTNFLGRWIYHCGWYPDPVLRLFRKSKGNFNEAVIHEKVEVKGKVGHLKGELLHYSYPDLECYLKRFNRYTTIGAQVAFEKGRRARWFDLVMRPPASFITHFISHQGFKDGMEGFLVSALSAAAVLVKYAKLRHMQKQQINKRAKMDDKEN